MVEHQDECRPSCNETQFDIKEKVNHDLPMAQRDEALGQSGRSAEEFAYALSN
jgi:hypothetical protein